MREGNESSGYLHKPCNKPHAFWELLWKYPSNEIRRQEKSVAVSDMSREVEFTMCCGKS